MQAHPMNGAVSEYGCDVLLAIARADGARLRAVKAAGGILVARLAIAKHPNNAKVITPAQDLLSLLK